MRKINIIALTLSCLAAQMMNAQTPQLWGMTQTGGAFGNGTIYKINADGTGADSAYYFGCPNIADSGSHPHNDLCLASDGKLYGMTYDGGLYNKGVIFSFDVATNIYTKLFDFDGISGANPPGKLVQADNGKLYGMTSAGGSINSGVLFSFDITANNYSDLYEFTTVSYLNSPNIRGSLIKASNGLLYGLTSNDGSAHYGALFMVDPSTGILTYMNYLASYIYGPYASLMQASDGKLYFTTVFGNGGTVSSYNITTNIVYDLHNGNYQSMSNLVQINNGYYMDLVKKNIYKDIH